MAARLHILGHPALPLRIAEYPEDSQVYNCWNFCQLAEMLEIDYDYYGIAGSQLPPGSHGTVVELGLPTSRWTFRNHWHQIYTHRLQKALESRWNDDDEPEWCASLYGVAHCDLVTPAGIPVFEAMLGYGTCWTHYRVFPSYAQQTMIYTLQPEALKDKFFDAVIPHFVNPDDFAPAESVEDYLCYLGRNVPDKGIALAKEVAAAADLEFRCVCSGCTGEAKRQLLAQARAVMMPTLYQEPFGYVAIEAMLSGTPVITTDWGAFPELIQNGVNGWRCRTAAEFADAVKNAPTLNRKQIRAEALKKYTIGAVAPAYRKYLNFIWEAHRRGGYYAPNARH